MDAGCGLSILVGLDGFVESRTVRCHAGTCGGMEQHMFLFLVSGNSAIFVTIKCCPLNSALSHALKAFLGVCSPFLVFASTAVPINIFHGGYRSGNAPIRVSYHGGNHYNAVVDPEEASVGQVWCGVG